MKKHNPQNVTDFESYRATLTMPEVLERMAITANGSGMISCLAHSEEHPSCKVYLDHLFCYSCGFYADTIGIIRHVQGCGFWEALEWIADQAGLPRPERRPEAQKRYEEVLSVSEVYSQAFHDSLKDPEPALAYLESRGISRATTTGVVGYLPPNYQPPDPEAAKRAGLYSQKGNFLFTDRLVIPILHCGRIISLYGRSLEDARIPKHVYPASKVPAMPTTLWNLDACRKESEIYLTESIIDAMTFIGRGFKNTAALFGTQAFSDARLEALRKTKIQSLVIVFDMDENGAGYNGAMLTGAKLFKAGYKVALRFLPLAKGAQKTDVNSYFADHSADDFRRLPVKEFFAQCLEEIPTEGSVEKKAEVVEFLCKLLAQRGDDFLTPVFLKQIRKQCPDWTLEALKKKCREGGNTRKEDLPIGAEFRPDAYADEILSQHHVLYHRGRFHFWKDGVYVGWDDLRVKRLIQELGQGALRKAHIEDVIHSLSIKTYVSPQQVDPPGIINLLNGYIDLLAEAPELNSHSPDLLSTIQLPIAFDPSADCLQFKKFLSEKIPDPSSQKLVQEIAGYLLTPDTSHQIGFVFTGKTRTGKSTLIKILTALIGPENRSTIPLERFGEKFQIAGCEGKLANFSSEVGVKQFLADGPLKALIGGDEVEMERKFQQSYTVKPYCRIVAACNDLPLTRDVSEAFFRRWTLVSMNQETTAENDDKQLAARICKEELSGVFLWALAGLARLRKNKAFTLSELSREAMAQWQRDADPVREFVHRFLKPDDKSELRLQKIFSDYNKWCTETNRQSHLTDSNFRKRLEDAEFPFRRKNTGWVLPGYWCAYHSYEEV